MSLASFVTIVISELLHLDYAITGGILAVLSIQLTRKDSYLLAVKRFLDALLAIALFTMLFLVIDFSVLVFAIGTVLFIALSFALEIDVGIVPSLVLASHILLRGSYSFDIVLNSFLLIFIASFIALTLNILYPLNTKKSLQEITMTIDGYIKEDLIQLANCMAHIPQISSSLANHEYIHQKLKKALYKAELNDKDILFDQNHMHMSYIHMRDAQMKRIHQIYELMMNIEQQHPHIDILIDYIQELAKDIGKDNMANSQLIKLQTILYDFKQSALPSSREEFETRAVLYQIMFELTSFLDEKIQYHNQYASL
jgi:uncharacterized membrane protein YgaE (UPF0421/DUF939 family)